MTRDEILEQYKVDEFGVIQTPGRFKGQPLYAPYFAKLLEDGKGVDQEEIEPELWATFFDVSDSDRDEFPELEDCDLMAVYEGDDKVFQVNPWLERRVGNDS